MSDLTIPTTLDLPIFDPAVLATVSGLAADFRAAKPFQHVVIDGLFDTAFLRAVEAEYYAPGDPRWHSFADKSREIKLMCDSDDQFPPHVKRLVQVLNSASFLSVLAELTGVAGLIPDPYFFGGGMHQIMPGGKLAIHADFNKHPIMKIDRRLNLLVYLNEDWPEAYGGHFELWDRQMQGCQTRIAPLFNRMVVFLTDDFSYHGHPDPLSCPPDRTRRSVALYYYTNGRPASELQDAQGLATTRFRERPQETFSTSPLVIAKDALGQFRYEVVTRIPLPLRALVKRWQGRR